MFFLISLITELNAKFSGIGQDINKQPIVEKPEEALESLYDFF